MAACGELSMQPGHRQSTTSALLPIGQSWRYDQLPLLSGAHVLQAFVPALHHLFNAQREPHGLLVSERPAGGQRHTEKDDAADF